MTARNPAPRPLTRAARDLSPSRPRGESAKLPTMNKLSAGGVFLLCLFLGIIFDQVAIGIIAGLLLGAGAGKVTAPKSDPET